MEFSVDRPNSPHEGEVATRTVTCCRIAMPMQQMVEFANNIMKFMEGLEAVRAVGPGQSDPRPKMN